MHSAVTLPNRCATAPSSPTRPNLASSATTNTFKDACCLISSSNGPINASSIKSVPNPCPAIIADHVSTALSLTAPRYTSLRLKVHASKERRSISSGKLCSTPASHTRCSMTCSNALTKSTRTAAEAKPLCLAASSITDWTHTAFSDPRPLLIQSHSLPNSALHTLMRSFLARAHSLGKDASNPMGLRPPAALGIRCINASSSCCGQTPSSSSVPRNLPMASNNSSDNHPYALGEIASTPTPVVFLNCAAAALSSRALNGIVPISPTPDCHSLHGDRARPSCFFQMISHSRRSLSAMSWGAAVAPPFTNNNCSGFSTVRFTKRCSPLPPPFACSLIQAFHPILLIIPLSFTFRFSKAVAQFAVEMRKLCPCAGLNLPACTFSITTPHLWSPNTLGQIGALGEAVLFITLFHCVHCGPLHPHPPSPLATASLAIAANAASSCSRFAAHSSACVLLSSLP